MRVRNHGEHKAKLQACSSWCRYRINSSICSLDFSRPRSTFGSLPLVSSPLSELLFEAGPFHCHHSSRIVDCCTLRILSVNLVAQIIQTEDGVRLSGPLWLPVDRRVSTDSFYSHSTASARPKATNNKGTVSTKAKPNTKDTTTIATSKQYTPSPMMDRFLNQSAKDDHFTGLGRETTAHEREAGRTRL